MPHPLIANGSLWTLTYEVLMYSMLVVFGLTRHLRTCCVVAFLACAVGWIAMQAHQIGAYKIDLPLVWRIGLEIDACRIAYLGACFFGASLLLLCARYLPLSRRLAGCLFAAALTLPRECTVALLAIGVPYVTLVLASRLPGAASNLHGWDLSYGVYVYAYPVQQLVTRSCLSHGLGWPAALFAATVLTLMLAGLSWMLIEKPALRLKGRLFTGGRDHSGSAPRSAQ